MTYEIYFWKVKDRYKEHPGLTTSLKSGFSLQVKYQRLFQMIFILGIGGSLQVGLQISMITYASVVSGLKQLEYYLVVCAMGLHASLRMLLQGNSPSVCIATIPPFSILSCKSVFLKVYKIIERRGEMYFQNALCYS